MVRAVIVPVPDTAVPRSLPGPPSIATDSREIYDPHLAPAGKASVAPCPEGDCSNGHTANADPERMHLTLPFAHPWPRSPRDLQITIWSRPNQHQTTAWKPVLWVYERVMLPVRAKLCCMRCRIYGSRKGCHYVVVQRRRPESEYRRHGLQVRAVVRP